MEALSIERAVETIFELQHRTDLVDAASLHDAVMLTLQNLGCVCVREHQVDKAMGNRSPRIDVFASNGPLSMAIELDKGRARERSLRKLQTYAKAFRIVVLRCARARVWKKFLGVDYVIGLGLPY